ncbi:hypothetical protein AAF712_007352 [Marasmius tenuissimus]|uniref:F-box domain-containing protein n=1 Tax=Marasmius tenuissimus TaxID=585030 RepID=A0ABR2ZVU8_9AGAR
MARVGSTASTSLGGSSRARTIPSLYNCACGVTIGSDKEELSHSAHILASLAESNDPPSTLEANVLCQEYNEHTELVASLDMETAQLQASMAALDRRRKQTLGRLPAYKLALNPIRRLPNEILAYIFTLCVDNKPFAERKRTAHDGVCFTLSPKNPPWVLSYVSRKWRSLALSLPQLWTFCELDWVTPGDEELARESETLKVQRQLSLCLQRAENKPLSIDWNGMNVSEKLLFMLLTRSYLWGEARLACNMAELRQVSSHAGLFQNLAFLDLYLAEDDWLSLEPEDQMLSTFKDAPNLRQFILSGDASGWGFTSNLVPWNQIVDFTITAVEPWDEWAGDCWSFLLLMENVRSWSLEMHDYPTPTTTIRLCNLHTLILRPAKALETTFLSALVLPALKVLRFEEHIFPEEAEAILSLLARSGCQLEELLLFGDGIVDVEMPELLCSNELKRLTTLHLSAEKLDETGRRASILEEMLHHLHFGDSDDEGIPVPHLRTLILTGVKQWTDVALVNMLASRMRVDQFTAGSATKLEEISLRDGGEDGFYIQDPIAKAQLARLVDDELLANFS